MSDAEILINLSEEDALLWIRLCRTLAEHEETPTSLQGLCDRVSSQITKALTQAKAS